MTGAEPRRSNRRVVAAASVVGLGLTLGLLAFWVFGRGPSVQEARWVGDAGDAAAPRIVLRSHCMLQIPGADAAGVMTSDATLAEDGTVYLEPPPELTAFADAGFRLSLDRASLRTEGHDLAEFAHDGSVTLTEALPSELGAFGPGDPLIAALLGVRGHEVLGHFDTTDSLVLNDGVRLLIGRNGDLRTVDAEGGPTQGPCVCNLQGEVETQRRTATFFGLVHHLATYGYALVGFFVTALRAGAGPPHR
jgi:hypothetical protein